jgi:hypothetical protein
LPKKLCQQQNQQRIPHVNVGKQGGAENKKDQNKQGKESHLNKNGIKS